MKARFISLIFLSLSYIGHTHGSELKIKKIDIVESNGVITTLKIFKGKNLFLSSRGENDKCHKSGIEARLNTTTYFTVQCADSPNSDKGMKSQSFATYDGQTIKIDSRSEQGTTIFFTHTWTIRISGETCTGQVHIESTFGNFDKSVVKCKVHY